METLARASSPRGELVLRRRDDDHLELRVLVGGLGLGFTLAPTPALKAAVLEVFGNAEEHRYDVPGHGRVGSYFLYSARR